MNNKKEIVILSLIFIAIIACIILLIVLKNKKTNKDEFYLSQNPIMYIKKTLYYKTTCYFLCDQIYLHILKVCLSKHYSFLNNILFHLLQIHNNEY